MCVVVVCVGISWDIDSVGMWLMAVWHGMCVAGWLAVCVWQQQCLFLYVAWHVAAKQRHGAGWWRASVSRRQHSGMAWRGSAADNQPV